MATYFRVDPDFYDHPKCIGMTDAATALWVRAGSYSVAKRTDGFIAEHVLVTLSTRPDAAAAELVERGLWKRTKGGHRFHEWGARNLTRQRIEEHLEKDRKRKRDARQNRNTQVKPKDVRTESKWNPKGIQTESARIPLLESSVESSVVNPPTPQGGKNGSRRSYDYDSDPDFAKFWDVYPRKVGKPAAFKAWKAARKRGVTAPTIIAATERYRDNPDRKADYTKHPGPWLNDERYNDFDEATETSDSSGWWNN